MRAITLKKNVDAAQLREELARAGGNVSISPLPFSRVYV
jgi:hypothetical protein